MSSPENEIDVTATTIGKSRLDSFLRYKKVGKDSKKSGNPNEIKKL